MMTSATTEREQQKATSSYDTTKVRFDRELDNPDIVAEGDMEETSPSSSTRASFATGDSSFEESTFSSVEVSVLPGESFDGGNGLGMFEKEKEKEKEDKDEESVDVSVNSVNDISRSRFRNEESSFEDNEGHKEKKESADNTVPESASTCSARREQAKDGDSFYDAVRSGNAKRVSALIANGCVKNLNEPDWNVSGDPPLLMAATNHSLSVLR